MELLLGKDGSFVRGVVLDEMAKGLDAAVRLSADNVLGRARNGLVNIFRVSLQLILIGHCTMLLNACVLVGSACSTTFSGFIPCYLGDLKALSSPCCSCRQVLTVIEERRECSFLTSNCASGCLKHGIPDIQAEVFMSTGERFTSEEAGTF